MTPDDGAKIYSNGLIRAFLETKSEGVLIGLGASTNYPAVAGLTVRAFTPAKRNRVLSLLTRLQSDAFCLRNADLAYCVDKELDTGPDVVVIDYFAMGWLLPQIKAKIKTLSRRPVIVYVAHNHEPSVRRLVAANEKNPLKRILMRIDAEKAVRLDRSLVQTADIITAITTEDREKYLADAPGKTCIVLTPGYDEVIVPTRPITIAMPRRVIITGSFDWVAKKTALRRFLNAAQNAFIRANIELIVVGRGNPADIEQFRRLYPFAHFTGKVCDVRPYMTDARIGIMPDEVGGGFKLKYLCYIFSGVAIATIRSQAVGLPLDMAKDLISANTICELVDAIVATIDDVEALEKMRQTCWNACVHEFNWKTRGQHLREAVEQHTIS